MATKNGGSGNDTLYNIHREGRPAEHPDGYYYTVYESVTYDEVKGAGGNDTIRGRHEDGTSNSLADKFYGESGNDSLAGFDGDDTLDGGDNNDKLDGGNGNDSLIGGNHNDTLNGGNNNDKLYGGSGTDSLIGGEGNDTLDGGDDNDKLDGGNGSDHLIGGEGNDTLDGGPLGNDQLFGGEGNDSLAGWLGNDLLMGEEDNDKLDGSTGQDTLMGGSENDTLNGGDDNDRLWGGSDADSLIGGSGNDELYGESGNDQLDAGSGNDSLVGGSNNDTLNGGDNNDTLYGGTEADSLIGGNNNDKLYGEAGADELDGGSGNDTLTGGSGNDTLDGGNDYDVVKEQANANFTLTNNSLTGNGTDYITNVEVVRLQGGSSNNTFADNGFNGDIYDQQNQKGRLSAVVYDGNITDYDISEDNGTWTVQDTNPSDGNDGTDTITGFGQIVFNHSSDNKVSSILNTSTGSKRTTISAVAGVDGETYTLESIKGSDGEKLGPVTYIIGLQGNQDSVMTFDFDTEKLGDFINFITLPSQDIEDDRLRDNIALDVLGTGLGLIPFGGEAISMGVALAQEYTNYGYDKAQIEAQYEATSEALADEQYASNSWINLTQEDKTRDLITIDEFQIGVDSIILPSVANASNAYYQMTATSGGVMVSLKIGTNDAEDFLFIKNNYDKNGYDDSITDAEFADIILDLVHNNDGTTSTNGEGEEVTDVDGAIISNLTKTTQSLYPDPDQSVSSTTAGIGTYAGDRIVGKEPNSQADNDDNGSRDNTFTIIGQYGDDFLEGGNDLEGDKIFGGFYSSPNNPFFTYQDDGYDLLLGHGGNDSLDGGSGNDTLDGGEGADFLTGGSEQDVFALNNLLTGIDTITDFELNTDIIQIGLLGAVDASQFSYDQTSGALSLDGIQFAEVFSSYDYGTKTGTGVNDLADELSSHIELISSSMITESGTTGNDTLNGQDDNELLFGQTGNDTLNGNGGSDFLSGGEGADQLNGGSDNDSLSGGIGNDSLNGDGGADYLSGGEGADQLNGGLEQDTLSGGIGNDSLNGEGGADYLDGGEGTDQLNGGLEQDTLTGGAGEDTFVFDTADLTAIDTITDFELNTDTLQFEFGVFGAVDASQFSYNQATGALSVNGTHLANVFESFDYLTGTGTGVSGLANALSSHIELTPNGTTGQDIYTGDSADNIYDAGSGNDILNGEGGKDFLAGGAGEDTLNGGTGNDSLRGGAGQDTFVFDTANLTEIDTITDFELNTDTVQFEFGIFGAVDGSQFSYQQTTGALSINGNHLANVFESFDYLTGTGTGVSGLANALSSNISFAANGTTGDDIYTGDSGNNIYDTGLGNDILNGQGGADYLKGGEGYDYIIGGSGEDTILGGTGPDDLSGQGGADSISGGEGSDDLTGGSGEDTLDGGSGNDVLNGQGDADYLTGGSGEDTFVFDVADVNSTAIDTITDFELNTDTLEFEFGVNGAVDISQFSYNQATGALSVNGTHLLNVFESFNHQNNTGTGVSGLANALSSHISFAANGTTGNNLYTGDSGNNIYDGGSGNDVVNGQGGNDFLAGGTGNDTLNGGTGNDSLRGDAGGDTFVLTDVTAIDTVMDFELNTDTLQFEFGVEGAVDGSQFSYNQATGALSVNGTHLANVFQSFNYETNTGTGVSGLANALSSNISFAANGITGNDNYIGDSGNNIYDAGLGNDTLNGGLGNDTLTGGLGKDTFVFNSASNQSNSDLITDFSASQGDVISIDTFAFYSQSGTVNFDYALDGGTNLTLSVSDIEVATLQNIAQSDIPSVLRQIQLINTSFNPEGSYIYTGGESPEVIGTSGKDVRFGGNSNETFVNSLGSDIMLGGNGADTFVFGEDVTTFTNNVLSGGYNQRILDFSPSEGDKLQIAIAPGQESSLPNGFGINVSDSGDELILSLFDQPIVTLENDTNLTVDEILGQVQFTGESNSNSNYDYVLTGGAEMDVFTLDAGFNPNSPDYDIYGIFNFNAEQQDIIQIDQSEYYIESMGDLSFNSSTGELSAHERFPIAYLENQVGFELEQNVVLI